MSDPIANVADCLKGGLSGDASSDDIKKFLTTCQNAAQDLKIDLWIDGGGMTDLQVAMLIRTLLIARVNDINDTLKVGLSRGYLLPDSPFPKIDQINASRPLFAAIPLAYNDQIYLLNAGRELSQVAQSYKDGKITFDRKVAAQLSSYEISVDGISVQSGDPLSDILGYQPDGDLVKRKRAIDSLGKLDFTKRKPYLLFTSENSTGGVVVCWGKMRDASGYVISRRDVFYGTDLPDVVMDNAALAESTKKLLGDDRFFQTLSFYDWTSPADVLAFSDDSVTNDTLYSYKISALQKKAPATPFIFDVPMTSLLFSPVMMQVARESLSLEAATFGKDPAAVSPYPAISQALYGDPSFGWIIAGCNILAAVRRGDSADSIRSISYVGSTAEHILTEAQGGRLLVPSDLTKVQQTVESAVTAYGISQTILSVMDGTGVTFFVSGKDDPNGIQPTQQSIEGSTAGLARILSAIDPETATLDPKLIVIGGQSNSFRNSAIQVKSSSANVMSLDEIIAAGTIDLTVYGGISRLMQLIRAVYDFYPGTFV